MERLLYALPLLLCPISMCLMMWFMMRGKKHDQPLQPTAPTATETEVATLRAELDQLKAAQEADHTSSRTASLARPHSPAIREGQEHQEAAVTARIGTAAADPLTR
jgi:hypothetical protein